MSRKPRPPSKASNAAKFPRTFLLSDKSNVGQLFTNLELFSDWKSRPREQSEDVEPEEVAAAAESSHASAAGTLSCRQCEVCFECVGEQRQHFKLDWHRFNLKLRVQQGKQQPVTEDAFDKLHENNDLESLSGSESDEEEEEEEEERSFEDRTRIHFINTEAEVLLSVFRCLLFPPGKGDPNDACLQQLPLGLKWGVLMVGGGHFAGAVFDGTDVSVHKTFHSYTVRAKQGGGQSATDSRSGTSHPRSAGASLRRYNEASLAQHVRDVIEGWRVHLAGCDLIFFRAAGANKKLIFGKDRTLLDKNDPRIRTVPFPTRRATFKEVKRVQQLLSTVEVVDAGGRDEAAAEKTRTVKKTIRRSKSRDSPRRRSLPDIVKQLAAASTDESDDVSERETVEVSTTTTDRPQGFEWTKGGEGRSKERAELENGLVTACMTGNHKLLLECILSVQDSSSGGVEPFLNLRFGETQCTALHVASRKGHANLLRTLLSHGADPTARDKFKRTAYSDAADRDTRNAFRRYQAENLDRHDWAAASVPLNDILTPEEEARQEAKRREKRKGKRQAKREREAVDRKEERERQKEEREKQRFLALSDREKRALAAERRLQASAVAPVSAQRCFQCAKDITGNVPFEYDVYRFCSPTCVREHRKKQ